MTGKRETAALFFYLPEIFVAACVVRCQPGAICSLIRQKTCSVNKSRKIRGFTGVLLSGIHEIPKKRPAKNGALRVPGVGIEPTRYCYHWCLRPTRLPIPPPGQGLGTGGAQIYAFCITWQKNPKLPPTGMCCAVIIPIFVIIIKHFFHQNFIAWLLW